MYLVIKRTCTYCLGRKTYSSYENEVMVLDLIALDMEDTTADTSGHRQKTVKLK